MVRLEPMSVTTNEDETIHFVFADINDVYQCSTRAIVTGTNKIVDALNDKMLNLLYGHSISLYSVTQLNSDDSDLNHLLSVEFLNSLNMVSQVCQITN